MNKTSKLRHWIAATLNDIFSKNNSYDCKLNFEQGNTFRIYNIPPYNSNKKVTIKFQKNKFYINNEDWMKENVLSTIWSSLNDSKKNELYVWEDNCWKTKNKNDIWVSLDEINNKSLSQNFQNMYNQWSQLKNRWIRKNNIDHAQAFVGGCRKFFDAYKQTCKKIFTNDYLKKISDLFNGYNFAHNKIGEEKNENEKIEIRSKNKKLKNISNQDLFGICEYLMKSLDIIYVALENEKLLRKE